MSEVLVVGAGMTGAALARHLAEAGLRIRVIDRRDHAAGNCHTARDPETGVMLHRYGPHIFHTDDAEVWGFVQRFGAFRPYRHIVRTRHAGRIYPLPVNLHTINQFYGTALTPDEARALLTSEAEPGQGPAANFEEQALRSIGPRLYEAFFRGYTIKQWGRAPTDLPAAVLRRLPVRFSYEDGYFTHRFQGIPEDGYTALVLAMLDHPNIRLDLRTAYAPAMAAGVARVFWTGPLDEWFGWDEGRLAYRTLRFQRLVVQGDAQGLAVMNESDLAVPHTRTTEFRHFTPWEDHRLSTLYRETSHEAGPGDEPYYPVRLMAERALLARYVARAGALRGVTFAGRLGTYRYLDMDVALREALTCAGAFLRLGDGMPAFAVDPVTEAACV